MPWANDGGALWNATRCSPVPDGPDQPGDPCTVEGGPTSGIDSCDLGAICWQVDPKTNEGVCHAICEIVGGVYPCDPPFDCAQLSFGVPLCVEPCDPVAATCPDGRVCAFEGAALTCQPVPLEGAQEGQACIPPVVPCVDGTLCAYDPAVSCRQPLGAGCCAAPCDVSDPSTCPETEVCVPWFPLAPPRCSPARRRDA